jgi:hypothetical protein
MAMQESLELVSIFREQLDETEWFGYVVGEGEDFLAIQCVSDRYDLDGYRVFRSADIDDVDDDFERKDLVERAMEIKQLEPRRIPWLQLTSARELVLSILEVEPLVVIEREVVCPEECEIGRVRLDSDGTYSLLWMTTNAEWERDDRVFRYDDITQVSFGGEYETTLARLAGPWAPDSA